MLIVSIVYCDSTFAFQNKETEPLIALGTNSNDEIPESSGLAISSFVDNAVWTLNDSGNSSDLFLLSTEGPTLGKVELQGTRNIDWEAMSRFTFNNVSYLLVADVGDNAKQRKNEKTG